MTADQIGETVRTVLALHEKSRQTVLAEADAKVKRERLHEEKRATAERIVRLLEPLNGLRVAYPDMPKVYSGKTKADTLTGPYSHINVGLWLEGHTLSVWSASVSVEGEQVVVMEKGRMLTLGDCLLRATAEAEKWVEAANRQTA